MIPYGRQYIDTNDIRAIENALQSDFLTTGPKVKEFEDALAKKLGFRYVVAVSSGTAALHLASICLLYSGDRVITTPISFVATSNSILYAGGEPIFVDITGSGLLDLDLVEDHLQKKDIAALYLVSLTGKMFDEDRVAYLKKRYNLKILYDNAHFFGKDRGVCDIATYSFHPVKHITTFEGGAIATNDEAIYERLLILRNHGIVKEEGMYPWEYEMKDLGFNYRLSDVASALGLSQLKKIDIFLKRRKEIAKFYHEHLPGSFQPLYDYDEDSSYHLFVVRYPFASLKEKARFFSWMRERGISLQLHYIPIYYQPYYQKLGIEVDCPNAECYYLEAFSLPIYYGLDDESLRYVVDQLGRFAG